MATCSFQEKTGHGSRHARRIFPASVAPHRVFVQFGRRSSFEKRQANDAIFQRKHLQQLVVYGLVSANSRAVDVNGHCWQFLTSRVLIHHRLVARHAGSPKKLSVRKRNIEIKRRGVSCQVDGQMWNLRIRGR
jgi:hypothetical protein